MANNLDLGELKSKAERDNNFYNVVRCLKHMIHGAKLTPEELRQALFYATWLYETENVRILKREMAEKDFNG